MCNAWNHPPECRCGWGGEGHLGRGGGGAHVWAYPLGVPPIHEKFESYTNPNARCPECKAPVFFYQSPHGGRVYFDDLGPPWPKHPCTDKPRLRFGNPDPIPTTHRRTVGSGVIFVTPDRVAHTSTRPDGGPSSWVLDGWECVSYEKSRADWGIVTVFGKTSRGDEIVLYFPRALFDAMRAANRRMFFVNRHNTVQFLGADGDVVEGQAFDTPPPKEWRPTRHMRPPSTEPRAVRKRIKRAQQKKEKANTKAKGAAHAKREKPSRHKPTPMQPPAPAVQKVPTAMQVAFEAARVGKLKPT